MGRVESQVAPWPVGDGRTQEVQYPELTEWGVSFNDQGAYVRHADRNVSIMQSGGNGTVTPTTRNNIPCLKFLNTDVVPNTSIFQRQSPDWTPTSVRLIPPALGGGAPVTSQIFPFWQVYANLAFDNPPPSNADVGFSLPAPQFGFQSGDGVFVRPGTNILAEWTILPDGRPALVGNNVGFTGQYTFPYNLAIDITQFHTYEIRVLQAGPTAFGSVQSFIDGKLHVALAYGPGTVLPPQQTGFPSFTVSLLNTGGNTCPMYLQRFAMRYAPSGPNLA